MQGHFLWQCLLIDLPHSICSFISWITSRLRIKLCHPKIIDPYSPKKDRVQISFYVHNTGKYTYSYTCPHTYCIHLRQQIPLPLSWPCQPRMIFRGTLDSRWVKLRFWEHHHSDCCTLKICGFLQKEKALALWWWPVFPFCSNQVTRIQADDSSW